MDDNRTNSTLSSECEALAPSSSITLRMVIGIMLVILFVLSGSSAVNANVTGQSTGQEKPVSQDNMELLAHDNLGGFGNGGEGLAMKLTDDGRRILYIAHESGPKCVSILDVTQPSDPKLINQTEIVNENVRCNSLDLSGETLIVAQQTESPGQDGAGMLIYDLSDNPFQPNEIGFFDTSGPYSRGVHYVWLADDRYAHISTGAADFEPRRQGSDCSVDACDDQFYMIVDLKDPTNPKEVGRWWYPGTRKGDSGSAPKPNPGTDLGVRAHHALVYPERPDRAYLSYLDGGIVTLDISDKAQPRPIDALDLSPPGPGFTHTALPLFSQDLLVTTDESVEDNCEDGEKRLQIMDNSKETSITPISTAPVPVSKSEPWCQQGGRSGAHNVYHYRPDEPAMQTDDMVVGAFFNRGIRLYDLSDPFHPEEVANYVPEAPEGSEAGTVQANDVYVDNRGLIYAVDRFTGGLYILETPLFDSSYEEEIPGTGGTPVTVLAASLFIGCGILGLIVAYVRHEKSPL